MDRGGFRHSDGQSFRRSEFQTVRVSDGLTLLFERKDGLDLGFFVRRFRLLSDLSLNVFTAYSVKLGGKRNSEFLEGS